MMGPQVKDEDMPMIYSHAVIVGIHTNGTFDVEYEVRTHATPIRQSPYSLAHAYSQGQYPMASLLSSNHWKLWAWLYNAPYVRVH
jgi:hypothetical protein